MISSFVRILYTFTMYIWIRMKDCIIERTIRNAINRRQIKEGDFEYYKGEYRLKRELNKHYSKLFFDAIVVYKNEIFKYIQTYYRCFMGGKDMNTYPKFVM